MSSLDNYRVETEQFVVTVDVDINGNIIHGPPYVRKFRGQPFTNLTNWCRYRFKDVKIHKLENGNYVLQEVDKKDAH